MASYALHAQGTLSYDGGGHQHVTGGMSAGGTVSVADGGLLRSGNGGESRYVESRETYVLEDGTGHSLLTLAGTGTFSRYSAGSVAGGSLALSSLAWQDTTLTTLSYSSDSLVTVEGTGLATVSRSGTGTELFQSSGLDSYSLGSGQCYSAEEVTTFTFGYGQSGAGSGQMHAHSTFAALGCYANHSLALSSFTAQDSVSLNYLATGSQGGSVSAHSLLTGTAWSGGTNTSSYSPGGGEAIMGGTQSRSRSESGTASLSYGTSNSLALSALGTMQQSSYAQGRYSLESTALDSYSYHEAGTGTTSLTLQTQENVTAVETITATGTITDSGSRSGPTGGGSSQDTIALNHSRTTSYASLTSLTLQLRGSETYSLHLEGLYAGHSFAASSLVLDADTASRSTLTYGNVTDYSANVSAGYSQTGTGTGTSTTEGTGTFGSANGSSEEFTLDALETTTFWLHAQETLAVHLEGASALGCLSLSCLSYDATAAQQSGSSYLYDFDIAGENSSDADEDGANSSAGSYFGGGSSTFEEHASEEFEDHAGGIDQQTQEVVTHLHQEGVYSGGCYALSSVLFTALGTVSSAQQGTFTSSGEGSGSLAWSSGGGDGVGEGGGGGSFADLGTFAASGSRSYEYASYDQQSVTATAGASFSLYQAGSYSHGSFSLSSYLYQTQEQTWVNTFATGVASEGGTGTRSGSASGYQQGGLPQGTYVYSFTHDEEHTSYQSAAYSFSYREEGTSTAGVGNLPTVIFAEGGSQSYTFHQEAGDHSDGATGYTYTQDSTSSFTAVGTSQFGHYERGSRGPVTWSLDSYGYSTSGHALSTLATSDSFDVAQNGTGTTYAQARDGVGVQVNEESFARLETGYRPAGTGLGTMQAFSWTTYVEDRAESVNASSVETTVTDSSFSFEPDPETYGPPTDGGLHLEQTAVSTFHDGTTYHGDGPQASGPTFSYVSFLYDVSKTSSSATTGTGTSWQSGGQKPASTTAMSYADTTGTTYHLGQQGIGLAGTYNLDHTATRTHAESGSTNGTSWGTFSSTQSYSSNSTGTFTLQPPLPQMVQDIPAQAQLDMAQGQNLKGSGVLVNDRPGQTDPAADASTGGNSGGLSSDGGTDRRGMVKDPNPPTGRNPFIANGNKNPVVIAEPPTFDMAAVEREKQKQHFQDAYKQAEGTGGHWLHGVSWVLSGLDWSHPNFIPSQAGRWLQENPRAAGAIQWVGGMAEMAAGGAMCLTLNPAGILVIIHGFDNAWAGARTMEEGQPVQTVTERGISNGLQVVGVEEGTANQIAAGTNAGLSIIGGGLTPKNVPLPKGVGPLLPQVVTGGAQAAGAGGRIIVMVPVGNVPVLVIGASAAGRVIMMAAPQPPAQPGGAGQPAATGTPANQPVPSDSDLSNLGTIPDRGGLTKAGRSLTKHGAGQRTGNSALPSPKGNAGQINQQAQQVLDGILNDPARVIKQRLGRPGEWLLQIHLPNGSGVIYKWDGTKWVFSHFGEGFT